jgi:4-carboxymuconolactone decarboxylase
MVEESETRRRGRELRRKLLGEAHADKLARAVYDDPLMQKFAAFTQEAVFGLLWTRPGLDLKTRALIPVISDVAQARWPELDLHLRIARNQGWTEDELGEAILHLAGYIGAPAVREALLTAREVFAELRKEEQQRP